MAVFKWKHTKEEFSTNKHKKRLTKSHGKLVFDRNNNWIFIDLEFKLNLRKANNRNRSAAVGTKAKISKHFQRKWKIECERVLTRVKFWSLLLSLRKIWKMPLRTLEILKYLHKVFIKFWANFKLVWKRRCISKLLFCLKIIQNIPNSCNLPQISVKSVSKTVHVTYSLPVHHTSFFILSTSTPTCENKFHSSFDRDKETALSL